MLPSPQKREINIKMSSGPGKEQKTELENIPISFPEPVPQAQRGCTSSRVFQKYSWLPAGKH